MTNYLLYWKLSNEERQNISSYKRTYAGGGQLGKVKLDDVLWIINIFDGNLYLIGKLIVGHKTDSQEEAKAVLDVTYDLWDASEYVIAKQDTTEYMKCLNINSIALDLRFVSSSDNDRLKLTNNKFGARQVQAMRELTNDSAQLLTEVWYKADVDESTLDYLELVEDDKEYAEGNLVARTTTQRKRNRTLIKDAKAYFKSNNGNRLFCEICGFDFYELYEIDYIEAHHTMPIGQLADITNSNFDNLMMLCANCHRALHAPAIANDIEKLKRLVNKNRKSD